MTERMNEEFACEPYSSFASTGRRDLTQDKGRV